MFGLDYTIFRPHNVYGEHQNIGDRYRNVIGIFMNQVFQGKPLTVFGDGEQSRAFSYISDVIAPMVACLDIPETAGQVFNVGADTPFTVNQLVRAVANAMETKVEVTHLEARNEVVHAYADHSKLRRFFPDLPPPVPLDDGLRRMAAWARRRGPQKTKRFAAVEVAKNMPDSWRKDFMD
jgi:UDP-glucose 4-epimerase